MGAFFKRLALRPCRPPVDRDTVSTLIKIDGLGAVVAASANRRIAATLHRWDRGQADIRECSPAGAHVGQSPKR